MFRGKYVVLVALVVLLVLCAVDDSHGKRRHRRSTRHVRSGRQKRSTVDRGLADYVKVFSAYLGEIPMTNDIKRLEKNLPTEKKMRVFSLKKSQRFARWNMGRGNKQVTECPKREELTPSAVTYVHRNQMVSAIDTKIMTEKGFILMQAERKGKYMDQTTDAMEVKFSKPVHIRGLQFLGKHNLLKVAIEWKDGSRWNQIQNNDEQSEWLVLQIDSKVSVFVPKTDQIRIYPQSFTGNKPIIFGVKFIGCF